MTGEREFFQDKDVTVTNARLVIRGTTYALAQITSVRRVSESSRKGIAAVAAMLFLAGLLCRASNSVDTNSIGLVLLVLSPVLLLGTFAAKEKHWVCITTSGAEVNTHWSFDRTWVEKVVAAIGDAIVARG